MVFSSLPFLFLFLPLSALLYYAAPIKLRCFVLLAVSLLFFAWGESKYLFLMLFTVSADYAAGLAVHGFIKKQKRRSAKVVFVVAIAINLGLLALFKYADFIIDTVNGVFSSRLSPLGLALPLGISFYTFQAMSYVIDVYRGKCEPQRNYIKFAMYIALFPQLIAGPIVRYTDIAGRIDERSTHGQEMVLGIRRFAVGLGKKVLLANTVGALYETLSSYGEEMTVLTALLAAVAYTFQIYFDFSGYSDMAIGLGHMFGFDFPENFKYPYEAVSITDFWRRWHITLSSFFKEYVYIPLGGSRCGPARRTFNLFVVWLLTGIWHGAGWTFAVWGLYFFAILSLEKAFLLKWLGKAPRFIGRVYSLALIVMGWIIFSSESLSDVGVFLNCLFGANGFADDVSLYYLFTNILPLLVMTVGVTHIPSKISTRLLDSGKIGRKASAAVQTAGVAVILIMSTAFIAGDTYNPFLYFRF